MASVRDERWAKHRCSVERWKLANYPYYLEQKRKLAHRPEYLAHRREMYAAKKARPTTQRESISTVQSLLNESEETNQAGDRYSDRSRSGTAGAQERHWAGAALPTAAEGVGEP